MKIRTRLLSEKEQTGKGYRHLSVGRGMQYTDVFLTLYENGNTSVTVWDGKTYHDFYVPFAGSNS